MLGRKSRCRWRFGAGWRRIGACAARGAEPVRALLSQSAPVDAEPMVALRWQQLALEARPQAARGHHVGEHLGRRRRQVDQRHRRRHRCGVAPVLEIGEFQRGSERRLDARIHDVDRIDLVEREVGQVADEHECGGQPRHARIAAEQMVVNDRGRERTQHGGEPRMPDAAMVTHAVEYPVSPVAHEYERAEPQHQHLDDRQLADREKQRHERKEHGEAREHGPARPRFLEVDVGQHRADHAGHGHREQIFLRDRVGGQRRGREHAADDRADADMGRKIGHCKSPGARRSVARGAPVADGLEPQPSMPTIRGTAATPVRSKPVQMARTGDRTGRCGSHPPWRGARRHATSAPAREQNERGRSH